MKNIIKILFLVATGIIMLQLTGCNTDDTPPVSVQDLTFEKLAGNWTLGTAGSIEVDGQDISLNYPGFTVSFTDGGYTTTNAGDLFRASGTWTWPGEGSESVNLDDGKELTITTLTETIFQFTFNFSGSGGVANGIAGNYSITVTK